MRTCPIIISCQRLLLLLFRYHCHCQTTGCAGCEISPLLSPLHTPQTSLSCLTQNISTGLAVAGVIVIARSIRVVTKFQGASEIPLRFIERNVSLRGKVHSITERGIEVEHVPIYLPVISPLLSRHRGNVGVICCFT
ncbi:hypothetical protein ATANTOWER_003463 [Ataeniobius toweri]|uniref:Uncharacterized protein n=1 Tax=Ataeniobius toweri TaxID=208326 RepID=A0ABU7A445_9TELE|nr:hypothetical protein [Ataeniobius toweri]